MEFLRVLDASVGVQDINILLFVDNCDTQLRDTSFLQYIQFVYYPPNCTGLMPFTGTVYVCMYVGKCVTFKFIYIYRHWLPHIDELCGDHVGCSNLGEEEKGYECDLEAVYRFCQSLCCL